MPNCFLLSLESQSGELLAVVPVTKGVEMFSPDCYIIGEMVFDQQTCKNSNLTIPKIIKAAITTISEEALTDPQEFQAPTHKHLPDKPTEKLIGYIPLRDSPEVLPIEQEIWNALDELNFCNHGKTIETAKYIPFSKKV